MSKQYKNIKKIHFNQKNFKLFKNIVSTAFLNTLEEERGTVPCYLLFFFFLWNLIKKKEKNLILIVAFYALNGLYITS
jgi:hypothetical protein